MGDDEAKVLEQAKKLPFSERLVFTNWKARVSAYEEVSKIAASAYDASNPALKDFGSLAHKVVADSNANAQLKALETLNVFLQRIADEEYVAKYGEAIVSAMAAKCLTGRPPTLQQVTECCVQIVELEGSEAVVTGLLKGFSNKTPKVVVAALDTLYACVSGFGAPTIPPKPILKALPPMFEHKDKSVREKAKDITVDFVGWIGLPVVNSLLLDKMSDIMKKDVQAKIEETGLNGRKRTPTRLIRKLQGLEKERPPDSINEANEDVNEVAQDAPDDTIDPYDLANPVEILSELDKKKGDNPPFWAAIKEAKWTFRKDALKELQTLADVPKLMPGDYSEVQRVIKKLIQSDSNVVVVGDAILAAGLLASGLRSNFKAQAHNLTACILDKFKDKSTIVVRNVLTTVTNFITHCYALTDVTDELVAALNHKVPKARMETLALLEETVPTLGRDGAGPAMKVLMPAIVKATDDADGKVRERAIGAIAAFGRACGGMASIGKYIEKMDEKKKKQIEEGVGNVCRGAAAAPAAAPVAAPAATAPPKKQALAPRDINAGTGGSKKSSPPPKKRSASAVGPKKTGTKKAEVENEENLEAGNFSPEEIEERVGEVVGAQTVANLKSANWKERLEGAEAFLGKLEEMAEGVDPHCEMIIRFLAPLITPEKNMQVTTKIIEVVTVTARNGMSFSRRDAHQSIEPVGVQMASHIRARIPCSTCLSTLCEAVGAGFVLKHLLPKAAKDKNPKVLSESLTWAATTVEEFGLAGVDVKGTLKELKEALSSSVAPTRTAATKVLGAMHVYLGAGIKDFLSDVKPALMTSIETEFQKMPHNPSQTPTRTVRQKKRAAAAAGGGDENAVEVEEEEDAGASGGFGLPAEDISGKMTPQLMKELGAADWKMRTAAMDQVDQILVEANRRIGPNLGHDLLVGLKGRLADTNRNLAGQSVTLFAALAQAMGSPIERQTRGYMPEILKLLSDNKKQVRDSVVKSLDVWAVAIGIDKITGHIAVALAEAKCSTDGKMEGSQWLAANLQPGKEAKEVMKVVAMDLKDKDGKVRDAGTKLLEQMLASCGHDAVAAAARSLKTTDKTLVDPVLAKMGMSASAAMPAASKPNLSGTAPAGSRPTSKVGSRPGSRGAMAALSRSTSDGIRRLGSAAAPVRASAAGALGASRSYGAPANDGPLLTMMDHKEKEKRAKANRGTKTIYEDPRPDAAEELKAALTPVLRADLAELMFTNDFKKQAIAAEMLATDFDSVAEETVSVLDLVLKWCVLRLVESNTTSLLKTMDYLAVLLEGLKDLGYRLTEYEAGVLLPTLLEKSGHNIVQIREKYRAVIRLVCGVYPVSKLLGLYMMETFHSKNTKSKVECLEQAAALIERHGMETTKGARVLPTVVELVGNRDTTMRGTALNTLAAVYRLLGDNIWKHLGKAITDNKVKDLINDKFRFTEKQMEKNGEGKAGSLVTTYQPNPITSPASSPLDRPRSGVSSPPMRQSAPALTVPGSPPLGSQVGGYQQATPTNLRTSVDYRRDGQRWGSEREGPAGLQDSAISTSVSAMATPLVRVKTAPAGLLSASTPSLGALVRDDEDVAAQWERALQLVASPDESLSVDGMKLACAELAEAAHGRSSAPTVALFVAQADQLVGLLVQKSRAVFNSSLAQVGVSGQAAPSSRPCKYVLNTLMQAFQLTSLARSVAERTLRALGSELLIRLLDDRIPRLEEGTALLKALNILMLKILENSQRNYTFSALLLLLRVPPPPLDDPNGGAANDALRSKFCDLVVKCLIKLTKALAATLHDMDLDLLLLSIHQFFMGLGVDEIRRRGQEDDKPLRMVKTVLHELCKLKGPAIRNHLTLVPSDGGHDQSAPIIHAYIDLNLQSLSNGLMPRSPAVGGTPGTLQRTFSATASRLGTPAASTPGAGPRASGNGMLSPSAELKQELAAIFKKIGDKESTGAGLEELYHFTQINPQVDITPHLSKTSEAFRIYIKRGLEKVQEEYRHGRAGDSALRTPPPPQMGTLSPDRGGLIVSTASRIEAAIDAEAAAAGRGAGEAASAPVSTAASAANSSLAALRDRMKTIQESVKTQGGAMGSRPSTAPTPAAEMSAGPREAAVAATVQPSVRASANMSMAELKERMHRLQQAGGRK